MPMRPRRIVPDVLLMPTFQIGNPVEEFIQVVIHDLPGSALYGSLQWGDLCTFYALSPPRAGSHAESLVTPR